MNRAFGRADAPATKRHPHDSAPVLAVTPVSIPHAPNPEQPSTASHPTRKGTVVATTGKTLRRWDAVLDHLLGSVGGTPPDLR